MTTSALEQLKTMTDIVADTGDIEAIKLYQPLDATTNPSLLYKAALMPQYSALFERAVAYAKSRSEDTEQQIDIAMDKLSVLVGCEIVNIVPGKVSTEVNARLSFNTQASVDKARQLIALYADQDIDKDRILIKLASTWEGIKAAEILEKEGIHCNLTLLFSITQAIACADAGAFLISPFVGRILDWHKKESGKTSYESHQDPGVLSVSEIYNYYKQHGIKTIVMGASFRNSGEILALAGCDRLTISPDLLSELKNNQEIIPRQLSPMAASTVVDNVILSEADFRYQLNDNAMATEKLAEGIRNFIKDQNKLEALIRKQLST
ncbi:MAG: transaldolase [Cellvibrionaceae bacterium]|jgi:transaldolase